MKKDIFLTIAIFLFLISGGLVFLRSSLTSFLKEALLKKTVYELASRESVEEIKRQTGKWVGDAPEATFLNKKVPLPLAEFPQEERVLGEQVSEQKLIEVILSEQRLKAWEGERVVYSFPISGGKWAPTPAGTFRIWIKLRYSLMHGGSKEDGTYYYLPNVPYVMYFYKGYGIHGAYWHNNFGTPMSHGCVNLSIPDAAALFTWADPSLSSNQSVVYPSKENPGTKVIIHQ